MKKTKLFASMLMAFALVFTACTNVNDPDPDPKPGEKVTIYSENFGTDLTGTAPASGWPTVANYATYQKEGKGAAAVVYSTEGGAVTLRGNQPSSAYTGASGANNAMIAAGGGSLIIKNIATCGAKKLSLSFGSIVVTDTLAVQYRVSGTPEWKPVVYKKDKSGWGLVENAEISLLAGTNTINLKFTAGRTQYGTRLDDISITTEDAIGTAVVDKDIDDTPVVSDTLNIAQAIAGQNEEIKWVKGYIVGSVVVTETVSTIASASDVVFGATGVRNTVVLLADSKTETDYKKCVAVNLPTGDIRTAVNLVDNPANLGKLLRVNGKLRTYFGIAGVRDLVGFKIDGYVAPSGDFDVPEMSIKDLRNQWTGVKKTITDKKKIVGIVITDLVGGNSTSLKNLTIASTDNSTGIIIRLTGDNTSYNLGDKIEINVMDVELNHYGEAIQLNNVPNAKTRKVGTGTIIPFVTTLAAIKANYAQFESIVVTIKGTITSPNGKWGDKANHQSNTLTSGADIITLFVAKYSNFVDTAIPTGEKTVTGVIGQNSSVATPNNYQLTVRNINDVK